MTMLLLEDALEHATMTSTCSIQVAFSKGAPLAIGLAIGDRLGNECCIVRNFIVWQVVCTTQYSLVQLCQKVPGSKFVLCSSSLWRSIHQEYGSMNKEPRLAEASVENRYRSAGAYLTFQGGGRQG